MPVAVIILTKEVWNGWFLPWNIFRICVYIHAPLRRHRGNSGGSFKLLSLTQTTYVWGGVFFAWEELRGVCWCCVEIFLLCLHKWSQEDWLTLVVTKNKFGSEINRRLRPFAMVLWIFIYGFACDLKRKRMCACEQQWLTVIQAMSWPMYWRYCVSSDGCRQFLIGYKW